MKEKPNLAITVVVVLIGLFLVTPTVLVMIMSFSNAGFLDFPPKGLGLSWYRSFMTSPEWMSGLWTSVRVAVSVAVIATILGTTTALAIARGRYPVKALKVVFAGTVLSPLIIPVVIVAIGTYITYSSWGLQGSYLGLVFAHTCLAIPFVVVSVLASLQSLDRNLESAARGLGAGPFRTFARITLPLILPGVVAGALFAFMLSWDEVVVSMFLTSPFVRTLPVVMWGEVQTQMDPTIAAVATMLTAATLLMFALTVVISRIRARKS